MQDALTNVGPISVGITVVNSFFSYKDGVYYDSTCNSFGVNHGVTIVGFGIDSDSNQYWIVKNSWGSGWGKSGYIYMARNRGNNCFIAAYPSYPII